MSNSPEYPISPDQRSSPLFPCLAAASVPSCPHSGALPLVLCSGSLGMPFAGWQCEFWSETHPSGPGGRHSSAGGSQSTEQVEVKIN